MKIKELNKIIFDYAYAPQKLIRVISTCKDTSLLNEVNTFLKLKRPIGKKIFYRSCKNGNLEVVKWITKLFNFTYADATSRRRDSLMISSKYGHLELVKWIVTTFQINQ